MRKRAILTAALAVAALGIFAFTLYYGTHKTVYGLLGCADPGEIARISVVVSGSAFSSLDTYDTTDPTEIRAFLQTVGPLTAAFSGRTNTARIPAGEKEYDVAVLFPNRQELVTLMSNGDLYRDNKNMSSGRRLM